MRAGVSHVAAANMSTSPKLSSIDMLPKEDKVKAEPQRTAALAVAFSASS